MKVLVILLMACLVAVQAKPHHEQPPHIKAARDKCAKELGLSEEQLKDRRKNDATEKEDCFHACFYKELGLLDDSNVIHKEKITEVIPPHVKDEDEQNINEACLDKKGANPCETAALLHRCLKENTPRRSRDPEREAAEKTCQSKLQLSEEALKKRHHDDDAKEDCFGACVKKELGIINEDGTINVEKAIEKGHSRGPEGSLEKAVDACKDTKGANPCETAALLHRCLKENTPRRSRDPEKEAAEKTCQSKLQLSDSALKRRDRDDNAKEDCFGACVKKELGVINEDGTINVKRAVEKGRSRGPEGTLEKAVDACKDTKHHVHFSGGSGLWKDNNIVIQPQRHGQIDAHIGFLQLHHRYHIEFSVPWNVCLIGEGKSLAPAMITGDPNPHCRVIEFSQDKDGLRLKVELLAYKEKLMKEEVQMVCCKTGEPLKILLNARVLGKDKGTPLLRNGIHSIAVEGNSEDEVAAMLRASLSVQDRPES